MKKFYKKSIAVILTLLCFISFKQAFAGLPSCKYAKVSAGQNYSLGIKGDDRCWGWGDNFYNQCGNILVAPKKPTICFDNSPWILVDAGIEHSIGVKTTGTLWSWGKAWFGSLGLGTSGGGGTPSQIGTATNWVTASAGNFFNLAIKSDGSLWAWGWNIGAGGSASPLGIYGFGTMEVNVPTRVGTASNWSKVSASDGMFCLAIKTDGTLWSWGDNYYGALGLGSTLTRVGILTQVGTSTDWVSISAGEDFSLALKTDGSLWAWGRNNKSQLGDGTTIDRNVPTQIGTATDWASIDAGFDYALAIKTDGTLWAWGNNANGQLGNGTTTNLLTPTQIGTSTDWLNVSAGASHSLAAKTDASLWAWGSNSKGQLGDNTTTNRSIPTQISAVPTITGTLTTTVGNTSLLSCTTAPYATAIPWRSSNLSVATISSTGLVTGVSAGTTTITYYTDIEYCDVNVVFTVTSTTAINESINNKTNGLNIYPNPSKGIVNIQSNYIMNKIEVYDNMGRIVTEYESKSDNISINTAQLNSGVYFIKIYTLEGLLVEKLLVE